VPRWATLAALAVPLCVLPSAVWRAQHAADVLLRGPGRCGIQGQGEAVYVLGLSAVSLTVAGLTLGLVRPWGEVLPRRLPIAGGRVVPLRLATLAAAATASVVALLVAYYLVKEAFGLGSTRELAPGCSAPDFGILVYYVPLIAWAPLLSALTLHYYRRRKASPTGLVAQMTPGRG
jgi:hypothetical protein